MKKNSELSIVNLIPIFANKLAKNFHKVALF